MSGILISLPRHSDGFLEYSLALGPGARYEGVITFRPLRETIQKLQTWRELLESNLEGHNRPGRDGRSGPKLVPEESADADAMRHNIVHEFTQRSPSRLAWLGYTVERVAIAHVREPAPQINHGPEEILARNQREGILDEILESQSGGVA
jgi:hypothetical protein